MTRRKRWTHRLPDGRLRVQCQRCAAAGLGVATSLAVCPQCQARKTRKAEEMTAFRETLGLKPAAGRRAAG